MSTTPTPFRDTPRWPVYVVPAIVLCATACASTVGGTADPPLDARADAPVTDSADAADATDASDGPCGVEDPRCSVRIDPGDRVVWVDQDVPLPLGGFGFFEYSSVRYGVRLAPYRIGRFEVTNAAYADCVRAGQCPPTAVDARNTPDGRDWFPADYPSSPRWRSYPASIGGLQALAVCRYLGGDLPTKAQWQYAADPTGMRRFPWGDQVECRGRFEQIVYWDGEERRVMCAGERPFPATVPVGANPEADSVFGLRHMTGNMAEPVYYGGRQFAQTIRAQNDQGMFPFDSTPRNPDVLLFYVGGHARTVSVVRQGTFLYRLATPPSGLPASALLGARCVWPDR